MERVTDFMDILKKIQMIFFYIKYDADFRQET